MLDAECTDLNTLVYTHIYPTLRVPDTELEQKTVICMAVNIDNPVSLRNKQARRVTIQLRLHTHQDQQRVTTGVARGYVRLDYLAGAVEDVMRTVGRQLGLAEIELYSNNESQLDAKHPCRVMKFTAYAIDSQCS